MQSLLVDMVDVMHIEQFNGISASSNFKTITPKILYFGTPVALIGSLNDDGSPNLAPMSSFWALGWTLVLGISLDTQTIVNLRERPECTVNLPSAELWQSVERLAPLTGRNPIPHDKDTRFRFERDKFGAAGLTPVPSEAVNPPRVRECPAQLEAAVRAIHELNGDARLRSLGGAAAVEVEVLRVHVREDKISGENHVDPRNWQPLIYNFRHYFGLGPELGKTFRSET
jgi:flavin reductase (DIM6/NTAB) family NADH-FMN oxidoreductase RutF